MRVGIGYVNLRSRNHYTYQNPAGNPGGPSGSTQASVSAGGVAVEFSLGGTLLPGFIAAAQLTSSMFTHPEISQAGVTYPYSGYSSNHGVKYTTLGALLLFYPDETKGLNSGVAAGLINQHWDNSHDDASGWFLAPQLGYEWWIGERWSLGLLGRATFSVLTQSSNANYYYEPNSTSYVALPSLSVVITNN